MANVAQIVSDLSAKGYETRYARKDQIRNLESNGYKVYIDNGSEVTNGTNPDNQLVLMVKEPAKKVEKKEEPAKKNESASSNVLSTSSPASKGK